MSLELKPKLVPPVNSFTDDYIYMLFVNQGSTSDPVIACHNVDVINEYKSMILSVIEQLKRPLADVTITIMINDTEMILSNQNISNVSLEVRKVRKI